MGMTPRELLRQVELPLALPSIVAGVRVAAVVGVGSATIAAAIGAGGLGEYIYRGLSMVDTTVILAGADSGGAARAGRRRRAAVAGAAAVGAPPHRGRGAPAAWPPRSSRSRVLSSALVARRCPRRHRRRVEELHRADHARRAVAQTIERESGLPVDRRLNLGGTLICDRALLIGRHRRLRRVHRHRAHRRSSINRWSPIRRRSSPRCASSTRARGRTLLPPLGFNNTFAILVRGADARARGLKTIDDAAREAPRWRAGFGYEFLERPDGYPGLAAAYGLRFRGPAARHGPERSAIARWRRGRWIVIAGDATAGLIQGPGSRPARGHAPLLSAVRCRRRRAGGDAAAVSARCGRRSSGCPAASPPTTCAR